MNWILFIAFGFVSGLGFAGGTNWLGWLFAVLALVSLIALWPRRRSRYGGSYSANSHYNDGGGWAFFDFGGDGGGDCGGGGDGGGCDGGGGGD